MSEIELPADAPRIGQSLSTLALGTPAVIERLQAPDDVADQAVLRRLMELGFLPGERVRVVASAWGGREPLAVRVAEHSTFALRGREADLIMVLPHPQEKA